MYDLALPPSPAPVATPLVIGRKEYIAFPEWHLRHLRVKVDTGAFSSVLDVAGYDVERDEAGRRMARLVLNLNRRDPRRQTVVYAQVLKMVHVTSSTGVRQERPLVEAMVRLGPVEKRIRMTVTNRSCMRSRMLLGREALAGSFLVDVSRKYLLRSDHPEQRI
jgi:hypothetical protein